MITNDAPEPDRRAEDVFDVVVPRILSATAGMVEEIWFYGSRARGDARKDSDWDFLALLPPSEAGGVLQMQLSRRWGAFHMMANIIPEIVLDIQEGINFPNTRPGWVLTSAKTEGRCIWSRGGKLYTNTRKNHTTP